MLGQIGGLTAPNFGRYKKHEVQNNNLYHSILLNLIPKVSKSLSLISSFLTNFDA